MIEGVAIQGLIQVWIFLCTEAMPEVVGQYLSSERHSVLHAGHQFAKQK